MGRGSCAWASRAPAAAWRASRTRRYRVGDYRVIVSIENADLRLLVIRVGHRREVYRQQVGVGEREEAGRRQEEAEV